MKKILIIAGVASLGLASCKKEMPDPGATSAAAVANEWWVMLTDDSGADVDDLGHFKITTYNTAANNNEIWIDDGENSREFKVKAQVNYADLSFSATNALNQYHEDSLTI